MKKVIGILILAAVLAAPAIAVTHSSKGCDGCHTPHGAASTADIPLWESFTLAVPGSFTMYANPSGTLDATLDVAGPSGTSLLCLSCHDGSTTTPIGWDSGTDMATNLADSHPISFVYNADLVTDDGGLKDPAADPVLSLLDSASKMQCSSCHDVHSADQYSLQVDNTAGALCKICHTK